MLEKIKLALRIATDVLDDEIQNDIDACMKDLERVGIVNIDQDDATIIRLAELYCKSALNFEDKGENYERAYRYMRDGISLFDEYNQEEN